MNHLVHYYLHQAGRGADHSVGHIYIHLRFLQRCQGIGSFLGGLWRLVRPLLWKAAKAIGSESLVTGRNVLTDMARYTDPNAKIRDVSRNKADSAHRVITKLNGRGRKRKRKTTVTKLKSKKHALKRAKSR